MSHDPESAPQPRVPTVQWSELRYGVHPSDVYRQTPEPSVMGQFFGGALAGVTTSEGFEGLPTRKEAGWVDELYDKDDRDWRVVAAMEALPPLYEIVNRHTSAGVSADAAIRKAEREVLGPKPMIRVADKKMYGYYEYLHELGNNTDVALRFRQQHTNSNGLDYRNSALMLEMRRAIDGENESIEGGKIDTGGGRLRRLGQVLRGLAGS